MTDARDGNTYATIKIGTQCWMAENLNVGTRINGSGNQTNNSLVEKYCYSNAESNCDTYGGLYQWNEMMQYATTGGAKGICPVGWHIPIDAEWTTLTDYFGGTSVAGGKLKEKGTPHWNSPNTGATNEAGFTGLPGGYRYANEPFGTFGFVGYGGYWWSSTQGSQNDARFRNMFYNYGDMHVDYGLKQAGLSARCLRD
jgi:uncharacterized protein (TIGR02145 family)